VTEESSLARLLDSRLATVDFSKTSTSKFRDAGVNQLIAEILKVPPQEIYATTVSKEGNLKVRFEQSTAARQAPIGVAVVTESEALESSVLSGTVLVGLGQKRAILFCSREPSGGWSVAAVIELGEGELAARVLSEFPSARVERPRSSLASAVRSPAGALSTVPLVMTDPRIERMVRLAVASAPAVMLVGAPGTGKTTMLQQVIAAIAADPVGHGFESAPTAKWVTPEESWTTRELVGGETVDDEGHLRFRPGHVLEAIRSQEWLVLDEANRADMDKIFGGLLTWLAGHSVELGRASTSVNAPAVMLEWNEAPDSVVIGEERLNDPTAGVEPIRFLAGREWRLLGTYNALDAQRVFRFGHALGRRFVRVPIPIMSVDAFAQALAPQVSDLPPRVGERIVRLFAVHTTSVGARLGPALFFWMPEYIRVGLRLRAAASAHSESDAEPLPLFPAIEGFQQTDADRPDRTLGGIADDELLTSLVAEAYLAAAGTWLARLDDAELDALGAKLTLIEPAGLPTIEWAWIRQLLPSLG
jgi:hypothetical protein